MEVAEPGLRLMRPGNRGGPGWDPPPHPVMVKNERKATDRRRLSKRNRPMHSSLSIAYESQPCPCASTTRENSRMNWKTCSVEVEARISKRPESARFMQTAQYPVIGMQKNELTMFRTTCYSSLVPRVHPGLLYAATFCGCVCKEWRSSFRETTFSDASEVRKHSSLKRACGAFRPYARGYAGQG
jgi:hypothetical protein